MCGEVCERVRVCVSMCVYEYMCMRVYMCVGTYSGSLLNPLGKGSETTL